MFSITPTMTTQERNIAARIERQMPFAISRALNDTAKSIAAAQPDLMRQHLDRPTPFTLRGATVLQYATKSRLEAVAGFRPIQAEYLRWQVHGGTRPPKRQAVLVPFEHVRLNQHGNMPKSYVARILRNTTTFVASRDDPKTRHLPPGIYKRARKPTKAAQARAARAGIAAQQEPPQLLVAFEDDADYSPIYPFYESARKIAAEEFRDHFWRNFTHALATAR